MATWLMFSFQNSNSPYMDNLIMFHNLNMMIMMMIITLMLFMSMMLYRCMSSNIDVNSKM